MVEVVSELAVMLRLDGRRCAVVGPPAGAAARLEALVAAGADAVHLGDAAPAPAAFAGAFLCMVTEDASLEVAEAAASAARAAGALVWCGDRPALSDFALPAVLRRGRLQISVSTGGASPALAVRLRDELARLFAEPVAALLAVLLDRLAAERESARKSIPDAEGRRAHLRSLVQGVRLEGRLLVPESSVRGPEPG